MPSTPRRTVPGPAALAAAVLFLLLLAPAASAQNTLVVEGSPRYTPSIYPDRVVLTFGGDPARTQAVTWRTDASVTEAVAEIAVAGDSPGLHLAARTVGGRTTALEAENGVGHHHAVVFTGLRPNTLYAYRVRGDGPGASGSSSGPRRPGSSPSPFSTSGMPRTR
jgi:phosphodiesterase/alkaline phosphatase D-like protein